MRHKFRGKIGPYNIGAGVLLFALLCVGCGKQDEPKAEAVVKTPDETSVDQVKFDAARQTTGISVAGRTNSGYSVQILESVRVGNQPGTDRVVFEFNDAGLPEWEVQYIDQPLLDCGSGEPVSVAGDAWLQISFRGAQAHTEAGEESGGPRRQELSQSVLRELVRTCDFEGEVIWVVGTARRNAYTTQVLADPSRLVVDVLH